MVASVYALGIADAWVYKSGNIVYVKHPLTGRILAKRRCLGQALMDCLEWLIDKKAQTDDKLVKIVLGPYRFQMTEEPITIVDLVSKFDAGPWPYYQTGIAIIGSEPMTMIECQDYMPHFFRFVNQHGTFPYQATAVYLDKLFIRLHYSSGCVVDIVRPGTLWIGILTIDAYDSKMGFRAVFPGSGDHRSIIHGLRVSGAEVNVYIDWDFRWIGFITSTQAKKHFAVLAGLNTCDFLHTLNETDGMPPPVVLRSGNYIRIIRRETTYLAQDEYFFVDATNRDFAGAGITCEIFWSDADWYGAGKKMWNGNLGPRGSIHIKNVISGVNLLGEVLYRGSDFAGPYKNLGIEGKTVLEIVRDGVAVMRPFFMIGGVPVQVSAGGTYTLASLTVPSGKKLIISGIKEIYDPSGKISAEVYNVTDATTVVAVDGEDWNTYEVPEGKTVEFRLKNADTVNNQYGAYIFNVSVVEA